MKNKCSHGSKLPRGLHCDRGYLIIRLKTDKGAYNRGCGPHTKEMEAIAKAMLSNIREQQYLKTFGLPSKTQRLKFEEAAKLFHQKHYVNYRDLNTNEPRSKASIRNTQSRLNGLSEFFGDFYLDAITLRDLKNYRTTRLEYEDTAPATLNREMAEFSSLLTQFKKWNMEDDRAVQIRLPEHNPCEVLPDLREVPRTRIASMDELRRLKAACIELGDNAMWSIIETEIHTSLRLSDLMQLENVEIKNGQFTITQGKTGNEITFPEGAKPKWSKVFTNFTSRWEKVRLRAMCADLQFRDLRKTGLQLLEKTFTPDQLATKAGHSDVKVTKKWYLSGNNSEQIGSMIEATRKMLQDL